MWRGALQVRTLSRYRQRHLLKLLQAWWRRRKGCFYFMLERRLKGVAEHADLDSTGG